MYDTQFFDFGETNSDSIALAIQACTRIDANWMTGEDGKSPSLKTTLFFKRSRKAVGKSVFTDLCYYDYKIADIDVWNRLG
jgi:hypothetical protein